MKLIAHRGNINGPNSIKENEPDYVNNAISMGFDVEIDIWYDTFDNQFYLGHDSPQYVVTPYWLAQRMDSLWIHCKNIDSLYHFASKTSGYNYFWHQNDNFTLTSKNYIWTYPGQSYTASSIIVMPEWDDKDWDSLRVTNCFGICSDFVGKLK